MRLNPHVVLASTNREKFEEFQQLLAAHPGIELLPAETIIRNADKLGFVERHSTYAENALAKARLANQAAHYTCLADDSGLEVDALGGKPGVRSHRYATPKAGLTQDQANVEFLLKELGGAPNRSARFVCTLALIVEGITLTASGTLEGTIIDAPRGTGGFGYDPIFVPQGQTKTLAELGSAEKNKISHRAVALRILMEQVRENGITFAKP